MSPDPAAVPHASSVTADRSSVIARWPALTAALLTSVVGLLIALDPHTWATPGIGWIGVAMVVVGCGLALVTALQGSRSVSRIVAVVAALVPAAVLLSFIALLLKSGD